MINDLLVLYTEEFQHEVITCVGGQ